jgi:dolichol-phosphate mannosyltransferase
VKTAVENNNDLLARGNAALLVNPNAPRLPNPVSRSGGATTDAPAGERPPAPSGGDRAATDPPATQYVLTVAMPAYNENATLREILARVLAVDLPLEVVVVDDGSTDGTREILRDEVDGKYPNVRVVYHEHNQGKGAAIVTAIAHARGEFLVVQDADLEYDPQDFHRLLEPLLSGRADVVYGSRFMGSIRDMKAANWLANRILTVTANVLYPGARITDEATCYKTFRTSVLRSFPLRSRRFDFCPEVTAKVLKRGYRIHELPIHYVARSVTQGKKIRWTDAFDAFWTLVKYRFVD